MSDVIKEEQQSRQSRIEAVRRHFENQLHRSLMALDLITSITAPENEQRLERMDKETLRFDPDVSITITRPRFLFGGGAVMDSHEEVGSEHRFLEVDDRLFIDKVQIPYPNLLVALNRYTRRTKDGDTYIMRIPIFGSNLMSKRVEDDVTKVVELVMDKKTFNSLAEVIHEVMWKDDKNRFYDGLKAFGLPNDKIPEVSANNKVTSNMGALFKNINRHAQVAGQRFIKEI